MTNATYRWMLYVTAYTALLGIPLLLFPNAVLPPLGFSPTGEPWVRLVGALLLALSGITLTINRKRISEMIVPSVFIRSWLILVLLALGIAGYPRFFFVMAAIVLIGVVGTALALRGGAGHGA